MLINNTIVQLPDEFADYEKNSKGAFSESEFIQNLMLNPSKYREFKRNINRINKIDNEINYLKSQEPNNKIDFVNNIRITKDEYNDALETAKKLFDNLEETQINELLSHKKLLSNEKHLVEAMAYFIGVENLDWNTFKLTFNLYEAKKKMNNIDYSKIRKKKINILLTQLCRGDSMESFLTNNDFGDSGMEFVYEWVKCQMKIYFYLYQNKKIKSKVSNNNNFLSGVYSHKDTIKEKINFDTPKDFSTTQTLRFGGKTTNSFKKTSYSVKSGTIYKQKTPFNTIYKEKKLGVQSQNSFLMTALPYVQKESKDFTSFSLYNLPKHEKINRIQNKEFNPIEARKIDIKLNGYDKYKDRIYREIKTAEMLPFLKNRTYHQMRDFFDIKIPLNKDIEKRHRKDINAYSMNGRKNEKKLMNLIAQGKGEIMNFLTLFKMKQIFSNYI
jgi:hypothetical protein